MKKTTVIILGLIAVIFMREIKHAQRIEPLRGNAAEQIEEAYKAGFDACMGQF